MTGLLSKVRSAFGTVPDTQQAGSVKFTMSDTLSSALAMFSLKYNSLLQPDTDMLADEGTVRHNLKTLFGVDYLIKNKVACIMKKRLKGDAQPIASSVIEGACRRLINNRLDITGARWSLKGAEAT